MPSPWQISIASTSARSSARAIVAHRLQMVLVTDRMHAVAQRDVLDVELRLVLAGHHAASFCNCCAGPAIGGGQRRRGHDVEIAGIGRQVVRRALDLEEDRGLEARARADAGDAHRVRCRRCARTAPSASADSRARISAPRRPCPATDFSIASCDAALRQREDRVAHDQRRLGRVQDDDRLAALGAAELHDRLRGRLGEFVDIGARAGAGRLRGDRGDDLAPDHALGRAPAPRRPSGSSPGRRRSPC